MSDEIERLRARVAELEQHVRLCDATVDKYSSGEFTPAWKTYMMVIRERDEARARVAAVLEEAARHGQAADISEADARTALQQLDPLWDELFPAEQARIMTLLVERVEIGTDSLNVRLRVDGLCGLAREMLAGGIEAAA